MLPNQLTPESFANYPPQARALAVRNLPLIRQLPIVYAALLLREISGYDWIFPAERHLLEHQLFYLQSLSDIERQHLLAGLRTLSLSQELNQIDWISHPQAFVDQLTAHLWSTHQIDAFHACAVSIGEAWHKAMPEPLPIAPRLGIVALNSDLRSPDYTLFRKLRPHGVFFESVDPDGAWSAIQETASLRAAQYPVDYGHWYIDGGTLDPGASPRLTSISWTALSSMRTAVLARMQAVIDSGHGNPEELRTLMAEMSPKDLNPGGSPQDEVLTRFQLSLLTEGSGTQVFSTTFVQWAAREVLRRAQPCTLVLRYVPRQKQLPMNELLAGVKDHNVTDPQGSLMDADMGAFYSWINQQRLPGAPESSFVAWSEANHQAVAIGPGMPKSVTSPNTLTMTQLLHDLL